MASGKNAEPRSVEGGEPGHAYMHDDTDKKTPVQAFALRTIHDSKTRVLESIESPDVPTPNVEVIELEGRAGNSRTGASAQELPDVTPGIGTASPICEWFHPLHAEIFGAYLTDMSRGGFADALDQALDNIAEVLTPLRETYRTYLPPVDLDDDDSQDDFQSTFDTLPGDEYARQADQDAFAPLVKVLTQIGVMKDQATRGLDHYGNPAGWAPNLSFAAQMDLERGAGENAMRALYVSQWLTSASDKIEAVIQSHWEAIVEVRKRRQMDFKRQGEMYEALSSLTVKSERLQADITSMKGRVQDVIDELETEAENRVIWAAGVDIVGSLVTVIPYGQPALGMVGKAVKSSGDYIGGKDASADNILSDILDRGKTLGKKGLAKRGDQFKKQADKLEEKAKSAEGAKYWDKYKSEERKSFDEAQASEAEESRSAAKVPKARAAQWSAVSDNFADAAKDIYSDFKVLACPEDAAKDLLKQLEENDDKYKQFSAEIEDLNLRKSLVVQEIIGAHVELGSIASDIALTHHMEGIFIDALTDASEGRVNPMVLGAADQMKGHALEWLTHQRYKLAKAYEALFLEPCPVPKGSEKYGVNWLVDQFESIVKTLQTNAESASDSREIWENSLEALRGFLKNYSTSIAQAIVDKIEGGSGHSLLPAENSHPIIIVLSPEQLAILNEGKKSPWANGDDEAAQDEPWPRTITINLGNSPYFPFDQDKAMIRSITVRDIEVSERDGANKNNEGYRPAGIVAYHFGNGILKSNNKLFAVRHDRAPSGTSGTSGGKLNYSAKWDFSYDEGTKEVTAGGGDGGDTEGTILALLGTLTQDNSRLSAINFFSSLPVWTELMITASDDAAQWAHFDKLVLEVHIDTVDAAHSTSGIDLRMDDLTEWPVIVTRSDGKEENYTTPALILGDQDTTLSVRPERFYERDVVSIDGHTSDDNTWDFTLRGSDIFHMKMAKEVREPDTPLDPLLPPADILDAPRQPLDWDQGAISFGQAAKEGRITRNEPVWNPHRALGYAYTFVDAYGDESDLSPWLTIDPVKYCFTKLILPAWPNDIAVADVKLYRRVKADARSGDWGAVEEIFAFNFNDGNGPVELVPQSSPLAGMLSNDRYEFFDGNM